MSDLIKTTGVWLMMVATLVIVILFAAWLLAAFATVFALLVLVWALGFPFKVTRGGKTVGHFRWFKYHPVKKI
jgi:hypothetical protein